MQAMLPEGFPLHQFNLFEASIPGKVHFLLADPVSPFTIEVTWRPPDPITLHPRGHVIYYHVILTDQYNFELHKKNVTGLKATFHGLTPNSLYYV